ncbi:MAG: hypothetical protein WC284_16225 [Candidimonas sp.]
MQSQGINLIDILIHFDQCDYVVDWKDFFDYGIKYGWKISTIIAKIEEALVDHKGRSYASVVILRLKSYAVNGGSDE